MSKIVKFISGHKTLSILSFAVFYQVFLAIFLAHAFKSDGLLYSLNAPLIKVFFYFFIYFAPVVWAFFKLPVSSDGKRVAIASVLSVAYIIATPPMIFLAGVQLKSDVKKVDVEALCSSFRGEWQDGRDIDEALRQLDGIMRGSGAKFSSTHGIKNDYVTYYFEVPKAKEVSPLDIRNDLLERKREKEVSDFLYQNRMHVSGVERLAGDRHDIVRVEFEARREGFQSLRHFEEIEDFKNLPAWMKSFTDDNGLTFIKIERRGSFSYVYSYDIRGIWGKIFDVRNYVGITAVFSGAIDSKERITDVWLEDMTCRAPFWKASWGYGPVPSTTKTYPPYPAVN